MTESLLPPNAIEQERALEAAIARAAEINVPLRELWNPETCPEELLPWLAWTLSVETWNPEWGVEVKRGVIRSAIETARRKGTRGAVQQAIRALGASVELVEWWQLTPPGPAHTFEVNFFANDSRTNSQLWSEQLEQAHWSKSNLTISSNVAGSPDGNGTADKLAEASSVSAVAHALTSAARAVTPGSTYVASWYVKAGERTKVALGVTHNETDFRYSVFDLAKGEVVSNEAGNGASIVKLAMRPGWFRIWVSRPSGAQTVIKQQLLLISDDQTSYIGAAGSGLFAWGAQLEVGTIPTGYIRTTNATVTRTDIQEAMAKEVARTKPVRSHFTVNIGAGLAGSINAVGIVRALAFVRLDAQANF